MRFQFLMSILVVGAVLYVPAECKEFCRKGRKKYKFGDEVPSKNPCEVCTCIETSDGPTIDCIIMTCAVNCPGEIIDDGSCCGMCEGVEQVCKHKRKEYDVGDKVPSRNPCDDCRCQLTEKGKAEVNCVMMMCDVCPGMTVDDGSCCGKCEEPTEPVGCKLGRKTYKIGQEVPSKNPCEMCICKHFGSVSEIVCQMQVCAMFCEGIIVDDGSCCGLCVMETEPVTCDLSKCPKLPCPTKLQVTEDGDCCPQCKCRVRRKGLQLPGPVGDECDNCHCDGAIGKVVCGEKPDCPKIECIDPIRGDDCCYHCPNGPTCMPKSSPKTIIKLGEYKKFKGNVCTCAGDPWYPYAFCAATKVNTKQYKGFAEYLVPFIKP